jgi:hypothetical protein
MMFILYATASGWSRDPWYGVKLAKYFQRIEKSENKLSERIFLLRATMQNVGEGKVYFRYCAFRAFFFAENIVRSVDTISVV